MVYLFTRRVERTIFFWSTMNDSFVVNIGDRILKRKKHVIYFQSAYAETNIVHNVTVTSVITADLNTNHAMYIINTNNYEIPSLVDMLVAITICTLATN